jgi:hypothetical protein
MLQLIVAGMGGKITPPLGLGLPSKSASHACYDCQCVLTNDICRMGIKDVGNNEFMVIIALPGLKNEENVNIDVHNDVLTISGEVESAQSNEGGYNVHMKSYGKFMGTLPLPRGTDVSVLAVVVIFLID